jgi:ADP-heptose:LPS heptosyltransferase
MSESSPLLALSMTEALVVVAPFSNAFIKDWPPEYYRQLIELCVERGGVRAIVVGTSGQRELGNQIIRALPAPAVENRCGTMSWLELGALIDGSAAVVGNDSGVAHLAATRGARTICIFGGSKSVFEWMARGPRVVVLQKRTSCSPCAIHHHSLCPYQKRCLSEISPEQVFSELANYLDPRTGRQPAQIAAG